MTDVNEGLLAEVRALAEAAGRLTLDWFDKPDLHVDRKRDGTEVTAADRAAERHIREYLAERHPGDAILGEEEGDSDGSTGRRWIIDPIDGTRGFVRGVPLYSTLIALVDGDQPVVGVMHFPALQTTVAAGVGLGCWRDDHRCSVSHHDGIDGALVTTSGMETFTPSQFAALAADGAMLRTWGDAYGYFLVATGQAEVMVDPICATWDLAPMPVIFAEAGGRFGSLDGSDDFRRGNGLGTNGHLHEAALAVFGSTEPG